VAGSVAGGAAWLMLPKALAASRPGYPGAGRTDGGTGATAGDAVLAIAFDHRLHTRLVVRGKPLTPWQPSESLLLADGAVDDFAITGHREQPVADARHGSGHQSIVTGRSGNLEKEVAQLKGKLASSQGDELVSQAIDVKGIKVLAARLDGADAKTLRDTMDKLKDKLKTAAIVLAAVDGGKVQIAAGVTADSMGKVKAGDLVNFVAQQVGGKGGGKADMAMAGGTDPGKLPTALDSVRAWVEQRL